MTDLNNTVAYSLSRVRVSKKCMIIQSVKMTHKQNYLDIAFREIRMKERSEIVNFQYFLNEESKIFNIQKLFQNLDRIKQYSQRCC